MQSTQLQHTTCPRYQHQHQSDPHLAFEVIYELSGRRKLCQRRRRATADGSVRPHKVRAGVKRWQLTGGAGAGGRAVLHRKRHLAQPQVGLQSSRRGDGGSGGRAGRRAGRRRRPSDRRQQPAGAPAALVGLAVIGKVATGAPRLRGGCGVRSGALAVDWSIAGRVSGPEPPYQ